MSLHNVKVYSRFERFWHWTQALLIFSLFFTGFAIHGLHSLISFKTAVVWHTWGAFTLIILWIFAIFWHLTTGTWRHYLPTHRGLWQVFRFYSYGIFRGEPHPYRKAFWRKHNPLQALAYLSLKLALFPLIWLTGLAYFTYQYWRDWIPNALLVFESVAVLHVAAAFIILAFVLLHIYLLSVGHSFTAHVKPMITGFDEVDLTPAEAAYLQESKAVSVKPVESNHSH
jgi:thiosulfate reductase cytochrome b subunit